MVNLLDDFYLNKPSQKNKYTMGKVTKVSSKGVVFVTLLNGVKLEIKDTQATYKVGNGVIISDFGTLNGAFIVKKTNFLFPLTSNTMVYDGQG